ncbi:hypothetical protein [Mangrovicoccus ximenensis]|uniref:hypothetical protein n=1 Tax=Mangrovicoccus ximenensis TaxID=1911570 RepID=UPI000D37865C|nr:hypothetical protein [Mangrovicoccus ximenensis]
MARFAIPVLWLLAGLPAAAQEARPFVFTQAHDNTVQPVAEGAAVEVQLPAGPVTWVLDPVTRNAELTGIRTVASPGRVPGSLAVQVFDFVLRGSGPAVIVLRPEGRPATVMHGHHRRDGTHGRAFASPLTLTLDPVAAD